MLLGCIADDVTGATDLGDTLVRAGLRTTLLLGLPDPHADDGGGDRYGDAVVVALKSRTIPAAEAVAQSLAVARWLGDLGAERSYFKYCSTFDSTDDGNIGPVTEALLGAVGDSFTVHCPAYPATGRTVYAGHLFVGSVLLSESPMRDHPLTPMRDADLVRVLGRQTTGPVGLVGLHEVRLGEHAVRARLDQLRQAGVAHAVVDATEAEDLLVAGRAAADLRLAAGASGLAAGLACALAPDGRAGVGARLPRGGTAAVFSGSCSAVTQAQVARFGGRRIDIDPLRLPDALDDLVLALRGALGSPRRDGHEADGPVLVTSTASPADVEQAQRALGRDEAGRRVEAAMARLAREAVDAGARRIVVAGGETAGAVTAALGVRSLEIGPTIAPGVPWTAAFDDQGRSLALACKSGNFGGPDFFAEAFQVHERAG